MPRGVKSVDVVKEEATLEEKALPTTWDTKGAIDGLIIKLVDDVKLGRTRDEFKTLQAISDLYNAVK